MARLTSLPLTYEQCRTLSITELSNFGYLSKGNSIKGILSWTKREAIVARISVISNAVLNYVEVCYDYGQTPFKYKIQLEIASSNLGRGKYFYFICPKSGIRCRKLYFFEGLFVHRMQVAAFYQWQLYGHKDRALCQLYEQISEGREAGFKMTDKNFRKSYKGNPTKRYIKYNTQKQFADIYPADMLNKLMVK